MQNYPNKIYISGLPFIYIQYNGEYTLNIKIGDPKWYSSGFYMGIPTEVVYIKKINRNPIYNWGIYYKKNDEEIMTFNLMNGRYFGCESYPVGKCAYNDTVFSVDDNSYYKMIKNIFNRTIDNISEYFKYK